MKKAAVSKTVFRENYKPFAWILDQVKLRFEIGDESTRVVSEIQLSRNPSASPSEDIELDGQQMELVAVPDGWQGSGAG